MGRMSAEDRLEIHDLHARYAWSYDCGDADGFGTIFAPDAVFKTYKRPMAEGRAGIVAEIRHLMTSAQWSSTQHYNSQLWIEGDDTSCTAWGYHCSVRWDPETRKHRVKSVSYVRTICVKIGGVWFMQDRLHVDWTGPQAPWRVGLPFAARGPSASGAPETPGRMTADDRLDILALHALYAWAFDAGDAVLFGGVFAPDGIFMTAAPPAAVGREAISARLTHHIAMPEWAGTQHYNSQLRIEGDGRECHSLCYFISIRSESETEPGTLKVATRVMGYTRCRCVKLDGVWYFAERYNTLLNGDKAPWKLGVPELVLPA